MKIGDVVAWTDVPSGAMVAHGNTLYVRIDDGGWCVGDLRFTKQCCALFGHYSDDWDIEGWERELADAAVNGWEWGVYETGMDA